MENRLECHQNIINFPDSRNNQPLKFRTKTWIEVDNDVIGR